VDGEHAAYHPVADAQQDPGHAARLLPQPEEDPRGIIYILTYCESGRIRNSGTFWLIQHCCGSVTYWYGSGSSNPYLCLTDADPEAPASYGLGSGCGSGTLIKSYRSHKTVESRFFSLFLLDNGRIRIRCRILTCDGRRLDSSCQKSDIFHEIIYALLFSLLIMLKT
jgi:hypothetical protein